MIVRSPFGHALAAARDNERRARALGFPVFRVRLTAFVISGAIAGIAGYFAAAQFGFVAPQMLGWHLSATVLVMVLIGGLRSVAGPLVGALVLIGLEEVLKALTEHWKLAEGLIIILIVLALPNGVRQLLSMVLGSSEENAREAQPSRTDAKPAAEAGHG
jgi:branched-chain amino acid transport system permease protein